jgi:beta,beta-carotene 9',10'-dioxygenase
MKRKIAVIGGGFEGGGLSVVLDENTGRSFLLILDANTFLEIARVDAPHAILFGYHGEFFQDDLD